METPGGSSNICFLRWMRWIDMINGIQLFNVTPLAGTFTRIFYILQAVQLLVAYNFGIVCLHAASLEEFAVQFNQFGGILLTFSRLININVHRSALVRTAQFINEAKFHHLNERADNIRTSTLRYAGRFLTALLGIQLVTLIFWFVLNELQSRSQDVLLPSLVHLPFDVTRWSATVRFAFRLYFYAANSQLMLTFLGSYVITSSYLLSLTIELRILNGSYARAPMDPRSLDGFLKDRAIYKVELLEHIGTIKRQMNVSLLLELVFIVCLLTINGLRLLTTGSVFSEVALSSSMILIYLLELFQYCWQVDEMELLHEHQTHDVYSTPWYNDRVVRQKKTQLLLTIQMAQVPLRFMSGGMYRLSVALFVSVVQFIYSLVMLLLQFKS
ncbi:uncharacterized protein LOC128726993 [Anopheles nili]|uniref:uncharacterized protein LOC128726993 n=1 Tax=Anopheles nili TaxID=185578 RepID=UPI00237B7ACE|nr:uncharacterized protein LOC128726993 [Anopheles nili]